MRIYVGGLRDLFATMGTVADANVIQDRSSGHSRGFGFVEMPDANEAKSAISGHSRGFGFIEMPDVNEAKPRESHG